MKGTVSQRLAVFFHLLFFFATYFTSFCLSNSPGLALHAAAIQIASQIDPDNFDVTEIQLGDFSTGYFL